MLGQVSKETVYEKKLYFWQISLNMIRNNALIYLFFKHASNKDSLTKSNHFYFQFGIIKKQQLKWKHEREEKHVSFSLGLVPVQHKAWNLPEKSVFMAVCHSKQLL